MNPADLAEFKRVTGVLEGTHWLITVKSQDQLERRKQMLKMLRSKKIGRLAPRPTAVGLLVAGALLNGEFHVHWKKEFREPRHICRLSTGDYLLTEMSRLLRLDSDGNVTRTYTHPFCAYLHTVDVCADERRALIVSSGFDSIYEFELDTGEETFRWFAWDHGFNPDEDGYWLAATSEKFRQYKMQEKPAILIDPKHYGEHGLVTARRSAHPNAAVYDPYDGERSIIVSIGHYGELMRVSLETGETTTVHRKLSIMPHGLCARDGGWAVTNTTKGEWWLLDSDFSTRMVYSVAQLQGKVPDMEEVEWLQHVVAAGTDRVLMIDANRGLIAVDLVTERYSAYQIDDNYCIQDALQLYGSDTMLRGSR